MASTKILKDGTIEAIRGDSFVLSLKIQKDGVDVNFDGWKAKLQVRTDPESEDKVIDIDEESGIDLSVPGFITITIDKEEMDFEPRSGDDAYVYDLEMTDNNGIRKTWLFNKKFNFYRDTAR